jgi:alpha-beta hydrolase superfamily lysophospholipase
MMGAHPNGDPAVSSADCSEYNVTTSDGTQLAVVAWEAAHRPTVLCVHGFPDDHAVWTGVAQTLSPHLRVVAFEACRASSVGEG